MIRARWVGLVVSVYCCLSAAWAQENVAPVEDIPDVIVPTLSTPLTSGKNAVWAASMPIMWKHLESEVTKGPVQFEKMPAIAELLSAAPDARKSLDPKNYYVSAGFGKDGIVDRIQTDMAAKFPYATLPTLLDVQPDDLVGYTYMYVNVAFTKAFMPQLRTLVFKGSDGEATPVSGFGILNLQREEPQGLREQVQILYCKSDRSGKVIDCVIELDRNLSKDRLILAFAPEGKTLQEMVDSVQKKINQKQRGKLVRNLTTDDSLVVPNIKFDVKREYSELCEIPIKNGHLSGYSLGQVSQNIDYSLNAGGAQLESSVSFIVYTGMGLSKPKPRDFRFDRPFILIQQRRDSKQPYFVLLVNDAQFLEPSPARELD